MGATCTAPSTSTARAVDFLLTAKRDLDAAKRFFRKMLKDGPLLSPDRIGTDGAGTYPGAITAARNEGRLARDPRPLRHQAPSARDRERPFPTEEEHAPGRRLPELQHGPAIHPGVRSHAVATEGVSASPVTGRSTSRTGCSGFALDFQRLTKRKTEIGRARFATHPGVCDKPRQRHVTDCRSRRFRQGG